VQIGASRYEFALRESICVEVHFELEDERIDPHAHWDGDVSDFCSRIAPARTFAISCELPELAQLGLARHVTPEAVILLAPDRIHCAGRPFSRDEPARHKLLDLIGDAYLYGGPPLGLVRALRPGHAANARAFELALAEGVLGFQ
jgi:UDP-3-O-[3-hydroxymyristoyl] N-acetylglucosamine deacetylase